LLSEDESNSDALANSKPLLKARARGTKKKQNKEDKAKQKAQAIQEVSVALVAEYRDKVVIALREAKNPKKDVLLFSEMVERVKTVAEIMGRETVGAHNFTKKPPMSVENSYEIQNKNWYALFKRNPQFLLQCKYACELIEEVEDMARYRGAEKDKKTKYGARKFLEKLTSFKASKDRKEQNQEVMELVKEMRKRKAE
jgi:hypothetical protein